MSAKDFWQSTANILEAENKALQARLDADETDEIQALWSVLPGPHKEVSVLVAAKHRIKALQARLDAAKKYVNETSELLQWDRLGWDVPEKVIEALSKAQVALKTGAG